MKLQYIANAECGLRQDAANLFDLISSWLWFSPSTIQFRQFFGYTGEKVALGKAYILPELGLGSLFAAG